MDNDKNHVLLTFDEDWAPEIALDFSANLLIENNIKSTWFITHESPILSKVRTRTDLFELGIHPNFLSGSSHGNSIETVLKHCLNIVPEAISVRAHSLFQSSQTIASIIDTNVIQNDVSLFLPDTSFLSLVVYRIGNKQLNRYPYFWEDDYQLMAEKPVWDLNYYLSKGSGLKIFNFHPIHVFLNTVDLKVYERDKDIIYKGIITESEIYKSRNLNQAGPYSFLIQLIKYLKKNGESQKICELKT
jgi:hypothetical protein